MLAEVADYPHQVVVVDDGSGTPAASWLRGARAHCLRHITNLRQGAALRTGTDYALSPGADVIVHFDADGQHKPALIVGLIEPIISGRCDVVLGSRFLQESDRGMVPLRKSWFPGSSRDIGSRIRTTAFGRSRRPARAR